MFTGTRWYFSQPSDDYDRGISGRDLRLTKEAYVTLLSKELSDKSINLKAYRQYVHKMHTCERQKLTT